MTSCDLKLRILHWTCNWCSQIGSQNLCVKKTFCFALLFFFFLICFALVGLICMLIIHGRLWTSQAHLAFRHLSNIMFVLYCSYFWCILNWMFEFWKYDIEISLELTELNWWRFCDWFFFFFFFFWLWSF